MTNADKLLKDGVTIEDFEYIYHDWLIKDMILEPEREMQLNKLDSVMRFLRTPCKPTLTEDEKVILRNLDEKWTYIYRDRWGIICLVDFKLDKKELESGDYGIEFEAYNHLFQFIKERRRIRNKGVIGGKICYELKKI